MVLVHKVNCRVLDNNYKSVLSIPKSIIIMTRASLFPPWGFQGGTMMIQVLLLQCEGDNSQIFYLSLAPNDMRLMIMMIQTTARSFGSFST